MVASVRGAKGGREEIKEKRRGSLTFLFESEFESKSIRISDERDFLRDEEERNSPHESLLGISDRASESIREFLDVRNHLFVEQNSETPSAEPSPTRKHQQASFEKRERREERGRDEPEESEGSEVLNRRFESRFEPEVRSRVSSKLCNPRYRRRKRE